MTDTTAAAQPAENVGRGTLVALLAIPIGMIAFGLVGAFGYFLFFIPIAIPYIAAWLYAKGAGAPLSRKGWAPWIIVTIVALVLSVATGLLSTAFTAVGSNLARFLPVIGTTLRYQIEREGIWLLVGIGLGVAGIIGVLRTKPTVPAQLAPVGPQAAATPTAPAAPAAPPAPNQPSPGVVLNGEPLDPNKP